MPTNLDPNFTSALRTTDKRRDPVLVSSAIFDKQILASVLVGAAAFVLLLDLGTNFASPAAGDWSSRLPDCQFTAHGDAAFCEMTNSGMAGP